METATKGNAAEAAVLSALVGLGVDVLVPFGHGQPFDLVVHISPNAFLRVQCKAARLNNGCLAFNGRATDHGRGRLPYGGRADIFGVHAAHNDMVYLVPVCEVSSFVVRLRVDDPRNNQRRGIRLAADYEIDRWTIEMLRELVADTLPPSARTHQAVPSYKPRALSPS